MKKAILSLIMILALVVTITSCKEEKKETTTTEEVTTETVETEVTESETTAETTEESTEAEATTTSDGSAEVPEKDVLNEESVTVTYAKMVNGMEVKAKKTFKGSQEKVEALVKAFEDSLKKVDPSIKIINE